MFADKHILKFVKKSIERNLDIVATSVIYTLGSTYAKAGNTFFVNSNKETIGVLGSPFLQKQILELSIKALHSKQNQFFESIPKDSSTGHGISKFFIQPFFNANNYGALGIALKNFNNTLARSIDDDNFFIINEQLDTKLDDNIFLQTVQKPYSVLIFGSGAHVLSFVDMSNLMGWETTVIDTKYNEACLINADEMIKLDDISEFKNIDLKPYNAVVILSHNPKTDNVYLHNLLKSDVEYIGMMGNKKNMQKTIAEFGLENDTRFFAPIGLDIGGKTHQAIALSICAQIEANKNKKLLK